MIVKEAVSLFRSHQEMNHKRRTINSYTNLLLRFETIFSDRFLESIGSDQLYQFLEDITSHSARSTRRLRYAQIKSFYNFIIDKLDSNIKNPCNSSLLSKSFRVPKRNERKILDKETMDEIIYKTKSQRDRLILELQARCGLRIGELLRLKVSDISDRKLIIREPKSGKDTEIAFMPEQIAKRLNEYVRDRNISGDDRLFPICHSTARTLIKKLGDRLHVSISPHDLRRHSATYASRNGVPLEIVSKVILRHQDLKTTQVYLGKVSEMEAIRCLDILHGR